MRQIQVMQVAKLGTNQAFYLPFLNHKPATQFWYLSVGLVVQKE